MKYWNDINGSTFFNMIFSSSIAINEIRLFILNIDNNYSTITLGFDIPEIPDILPTKWKTIEFNACRVGMKCSEIEDLSIKNLPSQNNLQLNIESGNSRLRVSAKSKSSSISFTTSFINLGEPSVYLTKTPFLNKYVLPALKPILTPLK